MGVVPLFFSLSDHKHLILIKDYSGSFCEIVMENTLYIHHFENHFFGSGDLKRIPPKTQIRKYDENNTFFYVFLTDCQVS